MPSDRLADVLSHAQSALQRFAMVLVCGHALDGTDLRRLLLTDLGLSRERLVVRRQGKRHIVYLDELTYRCASDRIRDEAFEVGDPPHLMRLFGISVRTAMRYVTAAHPERTAKLPR